MLRTLMHKAVHPMRIVPGSQKVPIGRGEYGKVILLELDKAPHTKICGLTGMGKSNIMLTLLYFLCNQLPSKDLTIEIIDLKGGATYAPWINVPQVRGVYASTTAARKVLEHCVDVMKERLEVIREARASFRRPPRFPLLAIMIDEGGELAPADALDEEKAERKRCMKALSTLVRVGREPGIRVIYGTQRPDVYTLPMTVRSQLDNTICFRVREKGDSEIVLGHEGAEQLIVHPGRAIFQTGTKEVEFQAVYIPEESLSKWIQSFIDKTTPAVDVGVVDGQQTVPDFGE